MRALGNKSHEEGLKESLFSPVYCEENFKPTLLAASQLKSFDQFTLDYPSDP